MPARTITTYLFICDWCGFEEHCSIDRPDGWAEFGMQNRRVFLCSKGDCHAVLRWLQTGERKGLPRTITTADIVKQW